jgi:hypothetical protein
MPAHLRHLGSRGNATLMEEGGVKPPVTTKTARHLAHFGGAAVVGIVSEFEQESAVRRIG